MERPQVEQLAKACGAHFVVASEKMSIVIKASSILSFVSKSFCNLNFTEKINIFEIFQLQKLGAPIFLHDETK